MYKSKHSYKKVISCERIESTHLSGDGGERGERDVGVLAKLELDTTLDEVEEAGTLLRVASNVLITEDGEEGVEGGCGVLDAETGEGVVGTTEEGGVGEVALDAVVELLRDQGRSWLGELEADGLDDPLGVDVLEVGDTDDGLQRDTIVQTLQTVGVPVLCVGVALDEVDGSDTALNLETVLVAVERGVVTLLRYQSVNS